MSAVHYKVIGQPYTRDNHTIQHLQTCEEVPENVVSIQRYERMAIISGNTWDVICELDDRNFASAVQEIFKERYK